MGGKPELKLYNTLTREKSVFTPIDAANVRMYVCGPTVYDFAHIGNARPAIVFDVLYRLLRHVYGEDHVKYVRNITDVDDKINARALRDYPGMELNAAIRLVTEKTYDQYQKDVVALGCLPPDAQPRATEHIAKMVELNQALIDKSHAYVAEGAEGREVLFSTGSMPDYGQLSKRRLEDQQAGARIAVEVHKKSPSDFVLWKESAANEPGWHADYRVDGEKISIFGRPGWHIECSAMSEVFLGKEFDIHGGGLDLIFPHHENEIAQSRCAHGTPVMANVWMHNGFLQVEGRKMSKSEGNFVTIHELLNTERFGGRMWAGPVLRYAMLMKSYREPLDFTEKGLLAAYADLAVLSTILSNASYHEDQDELQWRMWRSEPQPSRELIEVLSDDLDTRGALMSIMDRGRYLSKDDVFGAMLIANDLRFMGLMDETNHPLLSATTSTMQFGSVPPELFDLASPLVRKKRIAFMNGNVDLVGEIDAELERLGFAENEYSGGSFDLRYIGPKTESIDEIVGRRLELLKAKNFAEADKIRDDLLTKGIQLKDGKDPATGERVTTWEVKR